MNKQIIHLEIFVILLVSFVVDFLTDKQPRASCY